MSAKMTCTSCSKQIPNGALVCVFCSARQPVAPLTAPSTPVPSLHQTDPTLLGIRINVGDALAEASPVANGASAQTASLPAALPTPRAVEVLPPGKSDRSVVGSREIVGDDTALFVWWVNFIRLVMGVAGVVLMALFCLPWHGASSWHLLETLTGAEFTRQFIYLTGGLLLLLNALLPLPLLFRAGVGLIVPATLLLLGGGGLPAGGHSMIAAFAIVALSVTHLVRWRTEQDPAARRLIHAAVGAIALLYLWPSAAGVPIVAVLKLLSSGSWSAIVFGLFMLVPLVLAVRLLLAQKLVEVSVPSALVVLLWMPAAVALHGLASDDATQMGVALGMLCASATAALSLAQLLVLVDRAQHV
jgi:hypothetical protein